jgi:group II intron reverse transcriptase/maturase
MTTETRTESKEPEVTKREKKKKKNTLRHNEYYEMQDTLDRLYEDSKNDKIFKNLYELIIDEKNIKLAYRNIKRNTGSKTIGVNGHTIDYIANWSTEKYTKYVTDRLRKYDPHKVRRVEIPKDDGTGRMRPIGIPTIEDRLIQQCIKQILEPVCEAKFHNHSYGFRPNRSPENALARYVYLINRSKLHHVIDIDIKGFFDNVNHGKLLKQIWSMGIQDKKLISIISKMLKAEIKDIGVPEKGTPQGGILSPLLSNIVLNELDWWVSSQWETHPTRHEYTKPCNRYQAIKKTNLKEVFIVRYADDFKILCRNKDVAKRMYIAVEEWLENRLGLEINATKSKIVDLKKEHSEFLGFKLELQFRGGGRKPKNMKKKKWKKRKDRWIAYTSMTDKAKENCKKDLREAVKEIQANPNLNMVNKYNSVVLGKQNYYKIACNVNLDFSRIAYDVSKTVYNRLNDKAKKKKEKKEKYEYSKTYKKFYKNNYKTMIVAKTALFPIADVQMRNPMGFTQEKCDYTEIGRELIHNDLETVNTSILHYLMRNPIKNQTQEYNDNRISVYTGQQGLCRIMKIPLEIGKMETHHITPKSKPFYGKDEYKNLVFLNSDVHELIHATRIETIEKYVGIVNPDSKQMEEINKLREKVGNKVIS